MIPLSVLENGQTLNQPAILISPTGEDGFITAVYPEYLISPGDRYRAIASCEASSVSCSALFRLSYQDESGVITDLWATGEFYDQNQTEINLDLSSLAGQKVKFILEIALLNNSAENRLVWAAPGIYNIPPTLTATIEPSPIPPTSTLTPLPSATAVPSATPPPPPQTTPESQPPLEQIQNFILDFLKRFFGQ